MRHQHPRKTIPIRGVRQTRPLPAVPPQTLAQAQRRRGLVPRSARPMQRNPQLFPVDKSKLCTDDDYRLYATFALFSSGASYYAGYAPDPVQMCVLGMRAVFAHWYSENWPCCGQPNRREAAKQAAIEIANEIGFEPDEVAQAAKQLEAHIQNANILAGSCAEAKPLPQLAVPMAYGGRASQPGPYGGQPRQANITPGQAGLLLGATAIGGGLLWSHFRGRDAARRRAATQTPIGVDDDVTPPGIRDPDLDPDMPGTGTIRPGPNNEGPPPIHHGWGGGQYGPGPIPDWFDWMGNFLYMSQDCQTVAEPIYFLPIPGSQQLLRWWMPLNGGPEAYPTLFDSLTAQDTAILPGTTQAVPMMGTAWAFIARLVARDARDGRSVDPVEYATKIMLEASQLQEHPLNCDLMRPNTWGPAMREWWENFLLRVEVVVDMFAGNWHEWNPFWNEMGIA